MYLLTSNKCQATTTLVGQVFLLVADASMFDDKAKDQNCKNVYLVAMLEHLIEQFQQKIPNKRIKSIILHGIFWSIWLFRSFYDVYGPWGLKNATLYIAVVAVTQIPMVYFHLYVLIPTLLNKKKYLVYFLVTASLVLLYSISNYSLLQALPQEWQQQLMQKFVHRITPFYDVLEGVIVLLLTYALKYTLIAFITQNELLRLQKEKIQLELNALKAQINPHFLFNTLNNLYSLTLKNSNKSSEVVLKLSDIMRYVLYQSNEATVPLAKELSFISNYIELQRIRYPENYKINYNVTGNINGPEIAPLLLIDFIENGFKHGLDKRFNDGWFNININIENNYLQFNAVNAKGLTDEGGLIPSSNGIGLTNIKKRLELIYNGKSELKIIDGEEEYHVNLKLELQ